MASPQSSEASDTSGRYRLARFVWAKCYEYRVWLPNHPVYLAGAPLVLGAATAALSLFPTVWTALAFAIGLLVQAFVTYVNAAQAVAITALRREVWQEFADLTDGAAGHLSQVLRHYHGRYLHKGEKTKPEAYRQKLLHLQQLLLDHVVRVLHRHLGDRASLGVLSANWAVRGIGEHRDQFRIMMYDRNMANRQPSNSWRSIADNVPGASVSFRTGEVSLVPDTAKSDNTNHFSSTASYRSILSIPVLCSSSIVGVVNVDSVEIGLLETEQHLLVFDIAYLIGLCQLLHDGA